MPIAEVVELLKADAMKTYGRKSQEIAEKIAKPLKWPQKWSIKLKCQIHG